MVKKSCPFKYDAKKLELISEIERRRKLDIKVDYPMLCNLTKYPIKCVGEELCPIV